MESHTHKYSIEHQWDGTPIDHAPITVAISKDPNNAMFVILETEAPFFNDPGSPPQGEPGQTYDGLWEYEVVEAFFLGDKDRYLEVELCPHGQHLVLALNGVRNCYKTKLPLAFHSTITANTWRGIARIRLEYFPHGVNKFNAYAIHGKGTNRTYEALYHVPKDKYTSPDFHRLQYFQDIDFKDIIADDTRTTIWDGVM
ncbi:UPF0462 protein C4orf33 homolog [Asterias rubens]|uniref:UPF0462 protein C4orf33 homolog n=1 Tax=Asterias rubens TaxID=7604 RepID=UPI0014557DD9|nr:UPF0462 protein C4orf33 homolog [Asterias rubens]